MFFSMKKIFWYKNRKKKKNKGNDFKKFFSGRLSKNLPLSVF
jgi:hypothetical protein